MKFNKLRTKMLAGVLGLSIVGGGVTFAASGAGSQLRSWYSNQFKTASIQVSAELDKHAKASEPGITKEIETLKKDSNNQIRFSAVVERMNAMGRISAMKDKHIDDLNRESKNISDKMEADFQNVIATKNTKVNSELDQKAAKVQEDINKQLCESKDFGIGLIERDVNTCKAGAVKDLTTVIEGAKDKITGEIGVQKENASKALKDNFDDKVGVLQLAMEKETNKQIDINRDALIAKRDEKVEEAKLELDALVDGIVQLVN